MFYREDVIVSKNGEKYTLTAERPGRYMVYWSKSPAGFTDDNEVGVLEGELTFTAPAKGRLYFHMVDGSYYTVAANRRVDAPHMSNMREQGGYNTADGSKFVRHGFLFRSDALCGLNEAGMDAVSKLGLGTVIDFRTPNERKGREDPEIAGAKHIGLSPISDEANAYAISMNNLTKKDLDYMMAINDQLGGVYGKIVAKSEFAEIFKRVAETGKPVLYHCAAGKDRTGIQGVVILLALGVPLETALYDYMLTNSMRGGMIDAHMANFVDMFGEEYKELVATFFSVKESYIRGALDVIEERGGFDRYLEFSLGVDAETLARFKEACLIDHKYISTTD